MFVSEWYWKSQICNEIRKLSPLTCFTIQVNLQWLIKRLYENHLNRGLRTLRRNIIFFTRSALFLSKSFLSNLYGGNAVFLTLTFLTHTLYRLRGIRSKPAFVMKLAGKDKFFLKFLEHCFLSQFSCVSKTVLARNATLFGKDWL